MSFLDTMKIPLGFEPLNTLTSRIPLENESQTATFSKSRTVNLYGEKIVVRTIDDGGRFIPTKLLESVHRQRGDTEIDEIIRQLENEGRPLQGSQDLLEHAEHCYLQSKLGIENPSRADYLLAEFYSHYIKVPKWYNTEQIQRGQKVFLAYFGIIAITLFYRSLAPGFSIPKIAAVLSTTGYLAPPSNTRSVSNRLLDTGVLLCAIVSQNVEHCLRPESGVGWKAAIQVRILHAKVRNALLKRKGKRRWDSKKLGIPINQEDLSAVLLAFSLNTLMGCETILGFPIPQQEQLDYLAFWRYIGWLLGVDCEEMDEGLGDKPPIPSKENVKLKGSPSVELYKPLDPCGPGWIASSPNPLAHAIACSYSSMMHLIKPDATSITICHHILRVGKPSTNPPHKDLYFCLRALNCRRFIGDPLADALQLPLHPNIIKRSLLWCASTLLLWFLRLYGWAALPWSPFRKMLIAYHQKYCNILLDKWQDGTILKKSKEKSFATNDNVTILPTGGSGCPFAMVAPPRY